MDTKVNKKLKGKKMEKKRKNILDQINKDYKKSVKELKLEDSDFKKLGVNLDATSDQEDDKNEESKENKDDGDKEESKENKDDDDKEESDELPFSNIIQIESKRLIKKYIIMIKKTIQ